MIDPGHPGPLPDRWALMPQYREQEPAHNDKPKVRVVHRSTETTATKCWRSLEVGEGLAIQTHCAEDKELSRQRLAAKVAYEKNQGRGRYRCQVVGNYVVITRIE